MCNTFEYSKIHLYGEMMVVSNIIEGGKTVLKLTKDILEKEDENLKVSYPGTNYNLPIIYGLLG